MHRAPGPLGFWSSDPHPASPAPSPPPAAVPLLSRGSPDSGRRDLVRRLGGRRRPERARSRRTHAGRVRPPPAHSPVTIKGRRAASSPSAYIALHPRSSFLTVAGQTSAANMVKQIDSKVCAPGKGQGALAASETGGGDSLAAGRPPLRIPGGRGRGDSAWDCEKPEFGRTRGAGACPGGREKGEVP